MNHFRKNAGFTILELAVVTVIIIILIAVCVPAYQGYRVKSKLSEAYTLVDVIAKNEITYFGSNQEFYNVFEPLPQYINATMTITSSANWDRLGYPAPVGSKVNFNYDAVAGKTNSAGTQLWLPADTVSGNGFAVTINSVFMSGIQFDGVNTVQCNLNLASADTMGVDLVPNLDWTVIRAVGDLNNEFTTSCTAIARVIQASPATQRKASSSVQFVTFNLGK